MDTCICGEAFNDWMTHYCTNGKTKEFNREVLEAFIIRKDEEALKLLGKE